LLGGAPSIAFQRGAPLLKLVHFAQKILTIREIFVQTAENPENQKIFLKRG